MSFQIAMNMKKKDLEVQIQMDLGLVIYCRNREEDLIEQDCKVHSSPRPFF